MAKKNIEATQVAKESYENLSRYTIRTRTYHSIVDGLKSVARRLLYASYKYKSITKSATLVGDTVKYHPHGDSSIYAALVNMTNSKQNKFAMFKGEGNFGGREARAASMRYTSATMNDFGRLLLQEDLIPYCDYTLTDTEEEPVALPLLIPYVLLTGGSGFGVGMPNPVIPSYNIYDLIRISIDILDGIDPVSMIRTDVGEVLQMTTNSNFDTRFSTSYEGLVIREGDKLVVRALTPSCGKSKLLKSIKSYLDDESVIFTDESATELRYVFEIDNLEVIDLDSLSSKLERALRCKKAYKLIFEDNNVAHETSVVTSLNRAINYSLKCIKRKYEHLAESTDFERKVLMAIEELKKSDAINNLAKMTTSELVEFIQTKLTTQWELDVAKSVVRKPISYLTRSHLEELDKLESDRKEYEYNISNPDKFLRKRYFELLDFVKNNIKFESTQVVSYEELDSYRGKINKPKLEGYVVDNDTTILRKVSYLDKSEVELSDNETLIDCTKKYVVIIENNKWISVNLTSKLHIGKLLMNRYDGDIEYHSTDSEFVLINGIKVELAKYVKSRTSQSSRVKGVDQVEYIDYES